MLGENTVPFAPQKPGQNGSVGAPGYQAAGASQEADEVLYHHRPASHDLTTGPLDEEGDTEAADTLPASENTQPHATAGLQPASSVHSSLAYVSPSPDMAGSRGAPQASGTAAKGGFIASPAKKNRRPLLAAIGVVLGVLIVLALAASLLLPQLQSNTLSQTAATPTALAQNGAQSTATIPSTSVAAVQPGTPGAQGAAALPSPTAEQVTATATEQPATATAIPPTAVAPSPTVLSETTATPAPTQVAGTTYTVKSGDSLIAIARRYGTTAKDIMAANPLQSTLIRVGQVLVIPPPSTPTPRPSATATP
jgi:LysM repeat protein